MNTLLTSTTGVNFNFLDNFFYVGKEPHDYAEITLFEYDTNDDALITTIELAGERYSFSHNHTMIDKITELSDLIAKRKRLHDPMMRLQLI